MKKILYRLLPLLLMLLMAGGMVMAAGSSSSGPKKTVIGVSLPTQRQQIWQQGRVAIEEEAARLGVEVRMMMAEADMNVQATQVENLLSQGIDALILAPVDSDAVSTLVEKAQADGVPVVCFARLAMNCVVDYLVTCDNIEVGELQGRYLLDHIPNGSNIIVMSGAPTDNLAGEFRRGNMNIITPAARSGRVNVVTEMAIENWLPDNAIKIVENSLTQNRNNIQGVLAPNDDTAGGAIQALDAQGLKGKVVVTGMDADLIAIDRIIAGEQAMTVYKDIVAQAVATVQAAKALAEGNKASLKVSSTTSNGRMAVPTLNIPPTLITKENAAEFKVRLSN